MAPPALSSGAAARTSVLHIVRPAEGGMRAHVFSLLGQTDRSRFSTLLAAPADFLERIPPTIALAGAFRLPLSARFSPWKDVASALRFRSLTRKADVVHAHGLRAGWIAALAHLSRPFPLVVTAHNLIEPAGPLARRGLTLIGRRARRVVGVSEAVAEGLKTAGIPAAKISVIPNGIDLAYFSQTTERRAARQQLAVPESAFVVGCVARLSSEKGIDVLLGAARLTPKLTFLIAGDGPEREALVRALPPNARLLGRVSDTRVLLGAADVLAIPSRREGQGIVALEAMAAGVPLVASRVGGLAGMLVDGETALLVPPDDAPALAAALVRLQNQAGLQPRLVADAKRLVGEKYALDRMVRALEAVYTEVASRRPRVL